MTHPTDIREIQKTLINFLHENFDVLSESDAAGYIEDALDELSSHAAFEANAIAEDMPCAPQEKPYLQSEFV